MQNEKANNTGKTSFKDLSDEELVALIKDTNEQTVHRQCQEELYERYASKVFNKCLGIVRNKEDAKDLTHDIMVKILLKIKLFRGDSPLFGWIYAITYNHCLSWLKKKNKMSMQDFETVSRELAEDNYELNHKKLKEAKLETIQKLMHQLNEADRAILLMRYQDGLSINDISQILQLGESAVKMRLKRSRDRLSDLVNTNHDEE